MTHVGLGLCQGQNFVKLMSHNHEDDADLAGYNIVWRPTGAATWRTIDETYAWLSFF